MIDATRWSDANLLAVLHPQTENGMCAVMELQARLQKRAEQIERLKAERDEANGWFKSSEAVLGKILWQLGKAVDHINPNGELKGSGQWRIREIIGCLLEMKKAEEEGVEYDTKPRKSLADEIERLKAGINAVQGLINESRGVVGLHLNGDEAPWDELLASGAFEEWLLAFSRAAEAAGG